MLRLAMCAAARVQTGKVWARGAEHELRFNVGVHSYRERFPVNLGGGCLVAVAAGNHKGFAGGAGPWGGFAVHFNNKLRSFDSCGHHVNRSNLTVGRHPGLWNRSKKSGLLHSRFALGVSAL